MDAQHRRLLSIVTSLHEALMAGAAGDIVGRVLDELLLYTQTHFRAEEELMRQGCYAGLADHQAKHAALVRQVKDLRGRQGSGAAVLGIQTLGLLQDWPTGHILGEDKAYGAVLGEAA